MSTQIPTIKQLDQIRTTGFKPTVVVCLINDRKVLLLFKKEYKLWMLPQSGMLAKDEITDKLRAVITEELGKTFADSCDFNAEFLGEDQVEFLPEKQTGEEIALSDESKSFKMIGKYYYFFAVNTSLSDFDLKETIYDEYYWLESVPALSLSSKIYQPGKRRITMKAITLLKEKKLVD